MGRHEINLHDFGLPSQKFNSTKMEILNGDDGRGRLLNFEGMGVNVFRNSKGKGRGGVKTWKLSVVVYGYFLESPISTYL